MKKVVYKRNHSNRKMNSLILILSSTMTFGLAMVIALFFVGQGNSEQSRNPSWARLCGKDEENRLVLQDIFSDRCRAGGWFGESKVKWKCLCTMGPWALRFGWCQSEKPVNGFSSNGYGRFTSPELSCFRVAQDVTNDQTLEGILNLGKWSNRFKEGAPLIWTKATGGTLLTARDLSLPKIKKIPLTNATSVYALRSLPMPNTFWSILNPDTRKAVCLMPPKEGNTDTLFSYKIDHLWNVGRRTFLDFIIKKGCQSENKAGRNAKQEDDENEITFDWIQIEPESLQEFVLPKLDANNIDPDCSECLRLGSPFDPPATTEKCYPSDLDNMTALANEVDLQSERLAQHLGQKIMMNKTGSTIIHNMTEMTFLTKGAIMAFGACDMNYIPKQFYQFFLILVEALLSESYVKNPPNQMSAENFEKINQILDTCMAKTEPIKITPDKSCPPTYDLYEAPGLEKPLKADIFEEILADPRKHDYVMEFMFKIISFLHYHCYTYFSEAPILHDVLQVQLESIFRDDLLMRWIYPSNSYAMLDHLFRIHFDLKVTMENMEKCVVMTHHINNYRGVLKKAINQPHVKAKRDRKKRSLDSIGESRDERQYLSNSVYSPYDSADRYSRQQKYLTTDEYHPTATQSPSYAKYPPHNYNYYNKYNNYAGRSGSQQQKAKPQTQPQKTQKPSNTVYKYGSRKHISDQVHGTKKAHSEYREHKRPVRQYQSQQPAQTPMRMQMQASNVVDYNGDPSTGRRNQRQTVNNYNTDVNHKNVPRGTNEYQRQYQGQGRPQNSDRSTASSRNGDRGNEAYVRSPRQNTQYVRNNYKTPVNPSYTKSGRSGMTTQPVPDSEVYVDWPNSMEQANGAGGKPGGKSRKDSGEVYVDWPEYGSASAPRTGKTGSSDSEYAEYSNLNWPKKKAGRTISKSGKSVTPEEPEIPETTETPEAEVGDGEGAGDGGSDEWSGGEYNQTTGTFLGDNSFACLESLSEFVELNHQYNLYDDQCWDLPPNGLRPRATYLDIF